MSSNILKGLVPVTLIFLGIYWFLGAEPKEKPRHSLKSEVLMQDKQLEVEHKERRTLFTTGSHITETHAEEQITSANLIANVEKTLEGTEEAYERQLPANFFEVQAEIDAGLEGYQEKAHKELQNTISLYTEHKGSLK